MLFPENQGLKSALKDLRQSVDGDFYEESRQERLRRAEEEIVSYAKFLLPIEVWEDDLVTRAGGYRVLRDGATYDACLVREASGAGGTSAYLPLFTDWKGLYEGPYPGHVHAMVVTFKDCLRLIEESGDERGLSINIDGERQLVYDANNLLRLAALRESLIRAGRIDEPWDFDANRSQRPNVILRGPQNRVRMYLPGGRGIADCPTDKLIGKTLDKAFGVCECTVPYAAGAPTRDLLREVLGALNRVRPDQVCGDDIWEVYVRDDSETEFMVGRVSCADADAGQFRLEQMTNCCPVASFIYCEHLSRGLLNDLGAASHVRAETAFSERLQETMRYCALDNTYLRGCSYAYSREEVVHEYALERMELEGRKSAVNVLVAILMLVLGALIMYLTRTALWPGILAGIGSILFLLVLPVAAAEVVVHLIVKARAERFARQLTEGITLPSAGQHQARFSMGAGRILYRDESCELTLDGCQGGREILATEHYLLCPMQNGAMIPVPKSVL